MDSMKHYSTYQSQFIEMFSDVPKVGINTLVDTIWGSSSDSKTYNDTGEGVPFYQGKTEFGDLYINAPVTFCTAPVKMAKANAILMSVRAPVGAVNIATQDCCIGRGLASITPKEGKSTTMFIYFALKYMEEDIDRLGTGSTFKAINKESYAKIQMPNTEILDQAKFVSIAEQADKSKFTSLKSQFIEMQITSGQTNSLGDFIERCTPNRCGERTDLPILSVTKDKAIVFQDERFGAVVASNDKSNYIIAPRGYLVQGIHIDESNFGIQNLVDEGIVSPAYKLWRFKNSDAIPELIEYYLRSEMAIKYFRSKFLGATVPRRQVIRKEDFLDLPLNLPNMEEQKKYFRIYQQADKSKYIN